MLTKLINLSGKLNYVYFFYNICCYCLILQFNQIYIKADRKIRQKFIIINSSASNQNYDTKKHH